MYTVRLKTLFLFTVGVNELHLATRRLEDGENIMEQSETGRGCREKKRKVSTSDSADEDDAKDLLVNIHTTLV